MVLCTRLLALLPAALAVLHDGSTPVPNVEAPLNDPATMIGIKLTDALTQDDAKCLDGTPGFYYFRAGTGDGADKWYIHQEGGGWCESLDDCLARSKGNLGSSSAYTSTVSMDTGYFSLDPAINPLMYNWNSVFFKYCDGNSFSGSNSSTTIVSGSTLHWRGKHILNGGISDMLAHRGLDKATDVVVSGCSAGGLATFLHCDHWADRIKAEGSASANVVCMPDSGMFLDHEGPPKYHSGMTWAFWQQNSSSGVNDACIATEQPVSNCMFAEHTMKHIRTPTFPLQSEFDSWQTANDLGSTDVGLINQYGANLTRLVHTLSLIHI
eukprot:TRINITY_DN9608_c0_g1_i7.p1 TRINITY_DN9608_c0_g1~~TRINITY_DN9608_c0_g1_i7.p1  ORF type:complete len:324 (+),score=62.71 TRINITY_DN9608_c0_g1_i7:193-1164(+)